MADRPTEESFSPHVKTKFQLQLDETQHVELELAEVKSYKGESGPQPEWEQFSVIFRGPADLYLPQHIYTLRHEGMGEVALFLVPIGRDEQGFRYEAVFNYRK